MSRFADANPLLISDAATAAEARNLLRITGARHALAVYTRRGRVVGICTRADLQPKAIDDVLVRLRSASALGGRMGTRPREGV